MRVHSYNTIHEYRSRIPGCSVNVCHGWVVRAHPKVLAGIHVDSVRGLAVMYASIRDDQYSLLRRSLLVEGSVCVCVS